MAEAPLPPHQSIATQLLKIIFGVYFLVTLMVTSTQLISEYIHVQNSISQEILVLQNTFGPGLADAIWTFNRKLLQSILNGMQQISIVKGVRIDNDKGEEIRAIGEIIDGNGMPLIVDKEGNRQKLDDSHNPLRQLFGYEFLIKYSDENGDSRVIGKAIVYSGVEVVVNRVKFGFSLVILNSFIKTIALWFIFLAVVHHFLGKPLNHLTSSIRQIRWDQIGTFRLQVKGPAKMN